MSVEQFRKLRTGRARVKGAKTTVVNGWKFQSRLEADRYVHWLNMWQLRAIAWFTRQVPFYLPGGIIYRADFVVVKNLDSAVSPRCMANVMGVPMPRDLVIVEDCKGHLTDVSRNKIKQVEDIYRIKVEIITRENMR
jgi:hypothetical protein